MSTDTLTVRNCRFFYRQWGDDKATPLVMVHGHNRDGDDFAVVAEALARDYHVLVPDLRFHGQSEAASLDHPAGISDLAADLRAILEALDVRQPVMLGHSLGGMIALDYWRQHPGSVRALVIEDSFPDFLAGMNLLGGLFAPAVDPAFEARVRAKSDASAATGRVPASLWDSILAFNARPWLPTIHVPALALVGDRGWIDAAQLPGVLRTLGTALIPDLRAELFAECGHFVALEQPARYVALLRDFLSRRV